VGESGNRKNAETQMTAVTGKVHSRIFSPSARFIVRG